MKWVFFSALKTLLSSGAQRAEMKNASVASLRCYFSTAACVLVRVHVYACAQDACGGQRAVLAVTRQSSSVPLLSPSGWSSANLQLVSVRTG